MQNMHSMSLILNTKYINKYVGLYAQHAKKIWICNNLSPNPICKICKIICKIICPICQIICPICSLEQIHCLTPPICKICNTKCTIFTICNHNLNMQNMHSPLCRCRQNNQVCESFFGTGMYKSHIVIRGLRSVTTVIFKTIKLQVFYPKQDSWSIVVAVCPAWSSGVEKACLSQCFDSLFAYSLL